MEPVIEGWFIHGEPYLKVKAMPNLGTFALL